MGFGPVPLLIALLSGQTAPPADTRPIRAGHIEVVVPAPVIPAGGGAGSVVLRLEIRPRPGRLVYAPNQRGYAGFTLTFDPGSGIKPGRLVLPVPEPYVFEPTGEQVSVFRRPFTIEQHVTVAAGARRPISATLRYQACDAAVCYRPEDVVVTWPEPADGRGSGTQPSCRRPRRTAGEGELDASLDRGVRRADRGRGCGRRGAARHG